MTLMGTTLWFSEFEEEVKLRITSSTGEGAELKKKYINYYVTSALEGSTQRELSFETKIKYKEIQIMMMK